MVPMNVLFISHIQGHLHLKEGLLEQNPGMDLMLVESLDDALALLDRHVYDCTILADTGADDTLVSLRSLKSKAPTTPVVLLDQQQTQDTQSRRSTLRDSGVHDFVRADAATQLLPKITRYLSENARMRRELAQTRHKLDTYDALTGVLNRRGIAQQFSQMPKPSCLSVFMLDCDDLKALNQKFGYAVGDLALEHIAHTAQAHLPPHTLFGRVGGDRFLALMPETTLDEAMTLAENIRRAIKTHPIELSDGSTTAMTVSLGVMAAKPGINTISELIALAQLPLLDAKSKGVRTILSDSTAPTHTHRELTLLEDILSNNILSIAGQPIIDLRTNTIHSFELLCRGPAGQLASPYALFSAALAHNLLYALDISCIRTALAVSQYLPAQTNICLNILPSTLINTPPERLLRFVDEQSIDPNRVCLELNEQQLTEDPKLLKAILEPLQSKGIRLAIDDVGFGKTCLEHLLYLSPDYIKVDKAILHGDDPLPILNKIVKIGHVIDAQVIVEGVETHQMVTMTQRAGAYLAQGFLWGQPSTLDVLSSTRS